jgi:hypothetical protein
MLTRYLPTTRRIRSGRAAIVFAGLLPLHALAPAVLAAGSGFEVVSATDETVVLVFHGDPLSPQRGEDGALLVTDRLQPEGPIAPFVSAPGAAAWIALPPGTGVTVRGRVFDSVPLPWPAGMTAAERARATAALPPAAVPPAGGARAGEACWVHNQWGVPVSFRPLSVGAAGELRYVREAEITVLLPGAARQVLRSRPASGNDPFEESYRGVFANYAQGRSWRRAAAPAERGRRLDGFDSTPNPWVKVRVSRRGPHVISGEDLRALGLPLTGDGAVDPVTLRLFRPRPLPLVEARNWRDAPSWMAEVPLEVRGGGDGTLDPQDTIVFLGQGPDGWYDELGAPAGGPDRFYREPYDSEVVYWLTWGGAFEGSPKRIATVDGSAVSEESVTTVADRAHFESDEFWEPRQRESAMQPPEQNPSWERFWWLSLNAVPNDPERALRVAPVDPVVDRPVRLRVRLWGNSIRDPLRLVQWPDHAVRVKLNGTLVALTDRLPGGRFWDGHTRRDIDTTGVWLAAGEQELRFTLPYHPFAYPDSTRRDNIFLAWIEMDYTRRLVAHGDTIAFQSGSLLKSERSFSVTGFATRDLTVLDATDPFAPVRIQPAAFDTGGAVTLRFRAEAGGDPPRRFLAWSNAKLVRPRLELDAPPPGGYLRARTDPARMIVITHHDFREQAETLAEFRRTHFPGGPGQPDPASVPVTVIDVQDIYDEFSFGRIDPTALRNFLQCARERYDGGDPDAGPAYVLLVGDPHYDFRNTLGLGAQVFVPTYEGYFDTGFVNSLYSPQFGSDDFYAYLDGPTDVGLDLYIGRFPVRTRFEAETAVEKVQSYESAAADGPWKGRVTLVADDICQGTNPDRSTFLHMNQTEALPPMLPGVLQIDKIYLYEFGTECAYSTKPRAADALRARMNEGTLLVNFTGHGSDQQLADERVFETSGVPGLTNADRLFLFFTASCSVGKYDYFGEGLGESMLLHRGGGAIAVISASAVAYSGGNSEMNQRFFQALFPDRSALDPRPMGESAVRAKLTLSAPGDINSKRYVLLGDPAVEMAVSPPTVALALEDARSGAAMGDSLHRGVLTDLRVTVQRPDSTLDATFNGTVQVRVYDSSPVRPMGTGSGTYFLTGAPIFRGDAEVHGGTGVLRFQVPGALRTGVRGPAGLFVYAAAADRDALGALPRLSVPDSSAIRPAGNDHEGPRIRVHFEGDPAGLAPEAAFTADLFDSSGVNITGLVPSRSVILQIEEDGVLVVAEDLAGDVAFGGDSLGYRSAKVEHSLPSGLVAGRAYELVLRASDNVRNSASVRVPFTIAGGSGGAFALDEVYNFPNPTDGGAVFFGNLSGPADLEITIYTIAGKRAWRTREQGVTPVQLAREGISWDGRDADGEQPANGVYLYRIEAKPVGGGPARRVTGRLVVSR